LVGRVGEFVTFEAAAGAAAEEVDTMVPVLVCGVSFVGSVLAAQTEKYRIPLVGRSYGGY